MTEIERQKYAEYITTLSEVVLNIELDTVLRQIVSKDFTQDVVEMLAMLQTEYNKRYGNLDRFLSFYNARINAVKLESDIEQEMR